MAVLSKTIHSLLFLQFVNLKLEKTYIIIMYFILLVDKYVFQVVYSLASLILNFGYNRSIHNNYKELKNRQILKHYNK